VDYIVPITTEHSVYTADAPKSTSLHVTKGKLVGGWVYFPSGPAGLLHLQIRHGKYQLFPANRDQSLALDDAVVPLFLNRHISQPPFELSLLTWNSSTKYNHTLTVALFLDPYAEPAERKSFIAKLFGR